MGTYPKFCTGNKELELLYTTWLAIKQRCYNPKCKAYKHYGGRGIKMSEEWRNNFNTFFKDMGKKPSSEYSLERDNVNGNYCPENCRWIPKNQQSWNRRDSVTLMHEGQIKSVGEWSKLLNISGNTIHTRINLGWDINTILSVPIRKTTIVNQLTMENILIKTWNNTNETKKEGHLPSEVWRCCNGISSKHHNYKWEYAKIDKII